jgi:hypothetical protein
MPPHSAIRPSAAVEECPQSASLLPFRSGGVAGRADARAACSAEEPADPDEGCPCCPCDDGRGEVPEGWAGASGAGNRHECAGASVGGG